MATARLLRAAQYAWLACRSVRRGWTTCSNWITRRKGKAQRSSFRIRNVRLCSITHTKELQMRHMPDLCSSFAPCRASYFGSVPPDMLPAEAPKWVIPCLETHKSGQRTSRVRGGVIAQDKKQGSAQYLRHKISAACRSHYTASNNCIAYPLP